MIRDWNENGVVSSNSKIICVITLTLVVSYISFLTNLVIFLKTLIILTLIFVGHFVVTRPSGEEVIKY